jgi:hypothetical protein
MLLGADEKDPIGLTGQRVANFLFIHIFSCFFTHSKYTVLQIGYGAKTYKATARMSATAGKQ